MFISCVLPTMRSRAAFLPHAIRYFCRQHYKATELVIVTDGDASERIDDLVPKLRDVRYVHHPEPLALSDKYNLCVRKAYCDWIALWADDDWQAPWRLSYAAHELAQDPRYEIAGLRTMLFHRMGTTKTWRYQTPKSIAEPYFLGGSLVFHRGYWERHPFPSGKRSNADADFSNAISPDEYARVACILDRWEFYVAINHGENVGRRGDPLRVDQDHLLGWSWWRGDLAALMGDDAKIYLPQK